MKLIELRDKINDIVEKTPSWADVERIGIVTNSYEDGQKTCCGLRIFVLFVVTVKVWLHLNW